MFRRFPSITTRVVLKSLPLHQILELPPATTGIKYCCDLELRLGVRINVNGRWREFSTIRDNIRSKRF